MKAETVCPGKVTGSKHGQHPEYNNQRQLVVGKSRNRGIEAQMAAHYKFEEDLTGCSRDQQRNKQGGCKFGKNSFEGEDKATHRCVIDCRNTGCYAATDQKRSQPVTQTQS